MVDEQFVEYLIQGYTMEECMGEERCMAVRQSLLLLPLEWISAAEIRRQITPM